VDRDVQHGPGLSSIARGMRRLFTVLACVVAEALGLFFLISAPDSPGHVERVGGVLMMLCGLAPLLLGSVEERKQSPKRGMPMPDSAGEQAHAPDGRRAAHGSLRAARR
jgi:hypothetical protein